MSRDESQSKPEQASGTSSLSSEAGESPSKAGGSSSKAGGAGAKGRDRLRGEKSPSKQEPAELDEAKINAPSMPDLVMLGVICLATLIMWAAGRAACNYYVPGEGLTPRNVTLEERTRLPKSVGVEFAQALGGGDFAVASQLSVGAAAEFVKKDKADCGECSSRRQVADKLMSVGTVLQANSIDAIVSVRTAGGSGGEAVRILGIQREGREWRVSRVYASEAEAELIEPPARPDAANEPPLAPGVSEEGAANESQVEQKNVDDRPIIPGVPQTPRPKQGE